MVDDTKRHFLNAYTNTLFCTEEEKKTRPIPTSHSITTASFETSLTFINS